MNYHIDTGLIKEKFNTDCLCPLCEIQKIVEEQFLYEFLNDAVMEDNTRISVGKKGFCSRHFEMLFARPNKLSVALQIDTRVEKLMEKLSEPTSFSSAKKQAELIKKESSTCVICDLVEESMVKYYKTIAQMYINERGFYKTLIKQKGFCMHHYTELLNYARSAGGGKKDYVKLLFGVQKRGMERIKEELKEFCTHHDYRNAHNPLGSAETALPRMGVILYGEKIK